MRKQARPVRNPLSGPGSGQTSGQQPPRSPTVLPRSPAVPPRSPSVLPRNGASDMRLESRGTSSDTYEEAERVYYTIKDKDLPPPLRGKRGPPSQSSSGHQRGFKGRVRHGKGASDNLQEDQEVSSHEDEEAETGKRYPSSTSTGHTSGGGSGSRALCSFIHSHRSCLAAGIAVLLALVAVGLVPLTFFNKEQHFRFNEESARQGNRCLIVSRLPRACDLETKHLSITVDVLRRDLDKISKLFTTLDALKHVQEDIRHLFTTFDALKRDLENERNQSTIVKQLVYNMGNATVTLVHGALAVSYDGECEPASAHDNGNSLGQLALKDNRDPRGRLALLENGDSLGRLALQDNGDSLGRLALQDNGDSLGRLALQDNRDSLGRLALQDNGDPRGRLALQDNGDPRGRLAFQDNRDSLGRLALQDNGDSLGRLALQDNRDPRGRLAFQDNRDSLARLVLDLQKDNVRVGGGDTTTTATSLRHAKLPGRKLRQSVKDKPQVLCGLDFVNMENLGHGVMGHHSHITTGNLVNPTSLVFSMVKIIDVFPCTLRTVVRPLKRG
ncbi:hypothetical protein Bbelb_039850 [Branchiostoma belcheri]|nr:hypothetical protein Bbelb_039850 [Branchiostoma belcheri]